MAAAVSSTLFFPEGTGCRIRSGGVRSMRIVLFGPPGVGKGSQASLLQERLDLRHISTGIILRRAIRSGTPVGRAAEEYVTSGRLVPGRIVRALAEEAITEAGYDDFVLDGYPRTIEQAEWLRDFLAGRDFPLHGVISLQVPDQVIVDRLSKRRIDPVTGENYHLDFRPPPEDLPADRIVQREDDRPDAILKRLSVYRDQTAPVEGWYRERGELREVDGVGPFEEVHTRIGAVLHALASAV
jgi:adenylate kinase